MDRTSRPLYQQIAEEITARIARGAYQVGDKLPSERALCEEFQVSQITVRRALHDLAFAGRVYSRHGLGWYVGGRASLGTEAEVALVLGGDDPLVECLLPQCLLALSEAGIRAQAVYCPGGDLALQDTVSLLRGLRPRVVLWGVAGPEHALQRRYGALAEAAELPGLLWPRPVEGLAAPAVVLDEREAVAQVTAYLMAQGHRRIAYVGSDPAQVDGWRRYWGFATTVWEGGLDLPLDYILGVPSGESVREEWIAQVFGSSQRPTAVVCATDALAAETIRRLRALGLACPDDVSVAGLGDEPLGAYLSPSLTTFRLDACSWAQAMAQAARDLLDGRAPETRVFSGTLVIRESCVQRPTQQGHQSERRTP